MNSPPESDTDRRGASSCAGRSRTLPKRDAAFASPSWAELLNLEIDLAETLARRAARQDGATIDFDRDTG
jgi:hypothetical protein